MENKYLYPPAKVLFQTLLCGFYGLHIEGKENIPKEGAAIIAPNHKSYWDPPLVEVATIPRLVHFMAKEELFSNPFFGWLIRQFGTFPVKRGSVDRTAIRNAVREIKGGSLLGIFPEGTRIKREGLGRYHSGMAALAMMTGAPIIPVAIIGSYTMPKKKIPLAVLIGKPIPVKKQRPTEESEAELNEKVRTEMTALMEDYKKRTGNPLF